jgi:hypothetical protein
MYVLAVIGCVISCVVIVVVIVHIGVDEFIGIISVSIEIVIVINKMNNYY